MPLVGDGCLVSAKDSLMNGAVESILRDQAAFATACRKSVSAGPGFAVLITAAVWLGSALFKLVDFNAFSAAVRAHGVIPDEWLQWRLLVPILEAALGWGIICYAGSPRHRRTGNLVLAVAISALILFSCYLLFIPTSVLNSVGCGCHGPSAQRVLTLLPWGVRYSLIGFNLIVGSLHVWTIRRAAASDELAGNVRLKAKQANS